MKVEVYRFIDLDDAREKMEYWGQVPKRRTPVWGYWQSPTMLLNRDGAGQPPTVIQGGKI